MQQTQAPASHHRHPILAPADKGQGLAPGIAMEEGIIPGMLHLVGAGVPLYDGCLWERERDGRGRGLAEHPGFPASTYL